MGSKKGKIRYVLSKEFKFDASHRIINNYSGKCSDFHGHSWAVIVYIEGYRLDERNMLMDFNELKILRQWINDNLDHASILWKGDPMVQFFKEQSQKLFITPLNPTSEHLAQIILDKAISFFNNSDIRVESVEVRESCTSSARVYSED
jgi:6-pyruvoyltetrahydropterin/6-carboxytetrahydropterin synthase